MKKLLLSLLIGTFTHSLIAEAPTLFSKELLGFLNPQEYRRGPHTTLIQIPVLDQFKESSEKGSSNHSCAYHALRNSMVIVQALHAQNETTQALALKELYNTEAMYRQLSYEGDWRNFIRVRRNSNFTDNLSLEEVEALMEHEDQQGVLLGKDIAWGYFEYASPDEPKKEDFEAFNVGVGLNQIKRRLNAGEDFTAIVTVYVDTHDSTEEIFKNQGSKCAVCLDDDKATKKTPCCKRPVVCDDCWKAWVIDQQKSCPHCRAEYPGELNKDEAKKLSASAPLVGHYVGLVVAQRDGKRQYLCTDSACEPGRFFTSKPLQKLLNYFEDNLEKPVPLEQLPAFIPADPQDPQRALLKTSFENYLQSYQKAAPQVKTQPKQNFFEQKSFMMGFLGTLAVYICYRYYEQYRQAVPQKNTTTPVGK